MAMETPVTLGSLALEILRRLGDSPSEIPDASRIWQHTEIERYIVDGTNQLCFLSLLLWDVDYLDNLPNTANYRYEWERKYFRAPQVTVGLEVDLGPDPLPIPGGERLRFKSPTQTEVYFTDAVFTQPWEWSWMPGGHGPSNHTSRVDRDAFLVTPYVNADSELPSPVLQMDRATWDDRKIDPASSRELERRDTLYETVPGDVMAYLQDKDGLRRLRKWKRPSVIADYYFAIGLWGVLRGGANQQEGSAASVFVMHIDEFGSVFSGVLDAEPSVFHDFTPAVPVLATITVTGGITVLDEFSGFEVVIPPPAFVDPFPLPVELFGGTGFLRRLPGYFASYGPFGLARRMSKSRSNVRIEFYRRHRPMVWRNSEFEIPLHYVTYIRHYAMWQALKHRGPGQDLKLAKHYQGRWESGVRRVIARRDAIHAARLFRFGGTDEVLPRGRFAKLPRNMPDPGF